MLTDSGFEVAYLGDILIKSVRKEQRISHVKRLFEKTTKTTCSNTVRKSQEPCLMTETRLRRIDRTYIRSPGYKCWENLTVGLNFSARVYHALLELVSHLVSVGRLCDYQSIRVRPQIVKAYSDRFYDSILATHTTYLLSLIDLKSYFCVVRKFVTFFAFSFYVFFCERLFSYSFLLSPVIF